MKMRPGQVLLEILIALGVAVVALLAISQLTSKSIVGSGTSSRQSQASSYARSAIEYARQITEADGVKSKTDARLSNGIHCFNGITIASVTGDYCEIAGTELSGRITFLLTTDIGGTIKDELAIVSEVRWYEGSLEKIAKHESTIVFDQ